MTSPFSKLFQLFKNQRYFSNIIHCFFRAMPSAISAESHQNFHPKNGGITILSGTCFVILAEAEISSDILTETTQQDMDHLFCLLLLQLKATNSNKRKKVSIQKIELHTLCVQDDWMMIWLKSTQKNVVWRLKLTYLDVLLQGRTMFQKSLKNMAFEFLRQK